MFCNHPKTSNVASVYFMAFASAIGHGIVDPRSNRSIIEWGDAHFLVKAVNHTYGGTIDPPIKIPVHSFALCKRQVDDKLSCYSFVSDRIQHLELYQMQEFGSCALFSCNQSLTSPRMVQLHTATHTLYTGFVNVVAVKARFELMRVY